MSRSHGLRTKAFRAPPFTKSNNAWLWLNCRDLKRESRHHASNSEGANLHLAGRALKHAALEFLDIMDQNSFSQV